MAQDVLEAIKEEIELIKEIELYYKEEKAKKELTIGTQMYVDRLQEHRFILNRIVQRVENKLHYRLGIKEGKVRIIAE